MRDKKIILIGGAPTVGKSYLAKKLAEHLDIPWISTDTIREFMRGVVKESDYSGLFYFTKQDPNEYLIDKNAMQVVADQNKESRDVWKGVEAFMKTDYNWGDFIIEGVAVLPELIKQIPGKIIKPIFLLNDDKARIKQIIFERGLWTDAKKYPDSLKEKEIDWVIAFNDWLGGELKKFNYPAIKYNGGELNLSKFEQYL